MSKVKKILVTGGAGYIGSVLVRKLLEKDYDITIFDSLIYGNDGVVELFTNDSFKLIIGDIRDESKLNDALKGMDCVIHLAGIVGEPLCKKIPVAAKQINELATKTLVDFCKKHKIKRMIYSSTCSNYGSSDNLVSEDAPLNSLSLYSKTKVNSEIYILKNKTDNFEPCVLRFATAYGLSPRMRFDLLVQEFLRDALVEGKINIFGPNFWRPMVHVNDISDACILAVESDSNLISGQVYNVGNTKENYTKLQLAELVKNSIPETKIEILGTKQDPRNYRVSFEKIKSQLKFQTNKTVTEGISEILYAISKNRLNPKDSEFSNMSKMTEKVNTF